MSNDSEREADDLAEARTLVDSKAEQLKTISELAALVGGFAIAVMVNTSIDPSLNPFVVLVFGLADTLTVTCNLISLIYNSFILVAVLNFDCAQSVKPGAATFESFWAHRCEKDWLFAFGAFKTSIPCFICLLGTLGWVEFFYSPMTAISISAVATLTGLIWLFKVYLSWGSYTTRPASFQFSSLPSLPSPPPPPDEQVRIDKVQDWVNASPSTQPLSERKGLRSIPALENSFSLPEVLSGVSGVSGVSRGLTSNRSNMNMQN